MNKDKISSQEIIDLIAQKASISKRAAEEFLKVMIGTIEEALLAGEIVKIKNFGTFKLHWNEPRKSVNVQTGEDIVLDGYNKVNFVPDAMLRDLVNEPFAHLETVNLDENYVEYLQKTQKPDEELSDPLRIFTEQASEIKNLISEIQALSIDSAVIAQEEIPEIDIDGQVVVEEFVEVDEQTEDDDLQVDLVIDEEASDKQDTELTPIKISDVTKIVVAEKEEKSTSDSLNEENQSHQEKTNEKKSVILVSELIETPFGDKIEPLNKKKRKIWIPALILILLGSCAGLYYFYPPATQLANVSFEKSKSYIAYVKENVSFTDMINSVSKSMNKEEKLPTAPLVVIVPKDTTQNDTTEIAQSVDSLQMLFDNPRIYKDFIASERIKSGSRLTLMSRRYYGSKDFWVYIYEANKENIANPDQIPMGTLIHIPKLDPRLIDKKNPRCVNKAKELHDLYVK